MSIELLTLIMFGGLIVLLLLGLPLGFALGGIGVLVIYLTYGFSGLYTTVTNVFGMMWNIIFIALPLFIFMGVILERSGIAEKLFESVHRWAGPIRGGLSMGTVVICAIFAAMTGVTGAATVTMGLVAIPAMLSRHYDKKLALGTVAGGGTLGILIPPSIPMILLSLVGETSVSKLFMAGFGPGLLLVLMFIAYIGIRARLDPQLCPAHPAKFTIRQKFASTKAVILPTFIILAVLGSIFFGIATPTESSAVGAVAVLIALAIQHRFSWKLIKEATATTLRITGMVMWIGFGSFTFSKAYTGLGGIAFINGIIAGLATNPWLVLTVIMGIIFLLGMFIDPFAIIFIVAPISFPLIKALGFDPTWFGILFVINLQMGYISPPFGFNLFYLKSVVPPEISMTDIYRSIWPFIGIMALGMALIFIFPQIALWLPELMMKLRG